MTPSPSDSPLYDALVAEHGDPLTPPRSHYIFMRENDHDAWLRRVLAGKPAARKRRGKR